MDDLHKLEKIELIRLLQESQQAMAASGNSSIEIIHDLQVHRIEIELQNRVLREAQQVLEESRDLYAELYDFAPIGYLSLDISGIIRRININAADLLGATRQQLLGAPLAHWLQAEDKFNLRKHVRLTARSDSPQILELGIRTSDDRLLTIQLKSRADAEYGGCRSVMVDLTELKAALANAEESRQQLVQSNKQAEDANRAKSEFLANMSHEIRTPMNGVLSMSQVLLQTALDDQQRGYAQAINQSTGSLVTILNDILDLAKIESGKLEIDEANFYLDELVNHCRELYYPLARKKGLDFQLESDFGEFSMVRGDPTRVNQICRNLISNAFKFTLHGFIHCHMRAEQQENGDPLLRVEVKDSGPGIPKEQQERIFDRFTQISEGFAKRYAGTGLGLAISRLLVERLQGRIGVESEPGNGSLFYFEVPLQQVDDLQESESAVGQQADPADYHLLVVDDDHISRTGAELLLKEVGFQVTTASGGKHALELIRSSVFSTVLMDIHMPDLDGMETTRIIRADCDPAIANLPVIAYTVSVQANEYQMYLQAGMNDVLAKPVDLVAIQKAVFTLANPVSV